MTGNKYIYILTGEIQSGKTTTLMQWALQKENVYGILTPLIDGKRVFLNIQTKEIFQMEASKNETGDFLSVGKYVFSKKGFSKANEIITTVAKAHNESWLLIDEIGPLEIKGLGFASTFKKKLHEEKKSDSNILVVVRQSMLHIVQSHFDFNGWEIKIVDKENLPF